ncbi:MAG: hypothetical protein DGJ47_000226 [Rickettsiaceae bacterium]
MKKNTRSATKKTLNKKIIINGLILAAIGYFTFHSIYGDRGALSYFKLQAKLEKTHVQLDSLRAQRLEIENKTKLLRNESMDRDMLDEKIRNVLGLSASDEKILQLEKEKN